MPPQFRCFCDYPFNAQPRFADPSDSRSTVQHGEPLFSTKLLSTGVYILRFHTYILPSQTHIAMTSRYSRRKTNARWYRSWSRTSTNETPQQVPSNAAPMSGGSDRTDRLESLRVGNPGSTMANSRRVSSYEDHREEREERQRLAKAKNEYFDSMWQQIPQTDGE